MVEVPDRLYDMQHSYSSFDILCGRPFVPSGSVGFIYKLLIAERPFSGLVACARNLAEVSDGLK